MLRFLRRRERRVVRISAVNMSFKVECLAKSFAAAGNATHDDRLVRFTVLI